MTDEREPSAPDPDEERAMSGPRPKRFHSPALDEAISDISWEDIEADGVTTWEDMANSLHHPRWRDLVARARESFLRRRMVLRRWVQRATRGWADADWWNLNQHLCHHLGTLLLAMAEDGRTYPDDTTYDEWAATLRTRGEALLAFDMMDRRTAPAAQEALRWVAENLEQLWD